MMLFSNALYCCPLTSGTGHAESWTTSWWLLEEVLNWKSDSSQLSVMKHLSFLYFLSLSPCEGHFSHAIKHHLFLAAFQSDINSESFLFVGRVAGVTTKVSPGGKVDGSQCLLSYGSRSTGNLLHSPIAWRLPCTVTSLTVYLPCVDKKEQTITAVIASQTSKILLQSSVFCCDVS